jgi:hypothetical protein
MTNPPIDLLKRSKGLARLLHWVAARAVPRPRTPRRARPIKGNETRKGARDGQK